MLRFFTSDKIKESKVNTENAHAKLQLTGKIIRFSRDNLLQQLGLKAPGIIQDDQQSGDKAEVTGGSTEVKSDDKAEATGGSTEVKNDDKSDGTAGNGKADDKTDEQKLNELTEEYMNETVKSAQQVDAAAAESIDKSAKDSAQAIDDTVTVYTDSSGHEHYTYSYGSGTSMNVEVEGDGLTVSNSDISLTKEEAEELIANGVTASDLAIVLNGKDVTSASSPITLTFTVNGTASPQKIYMFHYEDGAWKIEGSADPKTVRVTVDAT